MLTTVCGGCLSQMYEQQNSWLKELVQGQRPPSLHDLRTSHEVHRRTHPPCAHPSTPLISLSASLCVWWVQKTKRELPGIDCDFFSTTELKKLFDHFLNLRAAPPAAASGGRPRPPHHQTPDGHEVLPFAAFHRPTPADLSGSFEAPGGKTAFGRFLACVSQAAAAFQPVNKAAPAPVALWDKSSGAREPKGVFPAARDFKNFAEGWLRKSIGEEFCQLFAHAEMGMEKRSASLSDQKTNRAIHPSISWCGCRVNLQEILTALIVTCHGTASRKALQLFKVGGAERLGGSDDGRWLSLCVLWWWLCGRIGVGLPPSSWPLSGRPPQHPPQGQQTRGIGGQHTGTHTERDSVCVCV